ncbi:helix-turn-helix domain-containing protein [Mycobacterium avium]|uniref:helix-turn-helix domain-containing protein n=1 Tax=Mycobacterium avium TaxID=1764 RepID=UPI000BAEC0A9|nr:helix-turn-helix transcriptional regulator [Mycobacterium avium]PBA12761.1 transcriptional regulator [Mycobacterium avium]PBA89225.1 transcriptional regulator [Mycobacterium avium]
MEKSITTAAYAELIRVLRDARVEAGMSQHQLAERLDEPQSFVSKYESGSRRLDLVELREIACALGLSLSSLVKRFEASL